MLQVEDIVVDISTTDAAVDFHLHKITKGKTNTLSLLSQFSSRWQYEDLRLPQSQIEWLKCSKCKYACLTSTTLTLNDHISASDDWKDGPLLHSGRFVESIGIHASKELLRYAKLIETGYDFELLWRINYNIIEAGAYLIVRNLLNALTWLLLLFDVFLLSGSVCWSSRRFIIISIFNVSSRFFTSRFSCGFDHFLLELTDLLFLMFIIIIIFNFWFEKCRRKAFRMIQTRMESTNTRSSF